MISHVTVVGKSDLTYVAGAGARALDCDIAIFALDEGVENIRDSSKSSRTTLRYQASCKRYVRCRAGRQGHRTSASNRSDHNTVGERVETEGAELNANLGRLKQQVSVNLVCLQWRFAYIGHRRLNSEVNSSCWIVRRKIETIDDHAIYQAIETFQSHSS